MAKNETPGSVILDSRESDLVRDALRWYIADVRGEIALNDRPGDDPGWLCDYCENLENLLRKIG